MVNRPIYIMLVYIGVNMGAVVRLTNVDIGEFDEFYSRLSVSARRMSREQMLEIADLLHEMIRERRGQDCKVGSGDMRWRSQRQTQGV